MNGPLSLWLHESLPSLPSWAPATSESVDVLVVGAGLAGLSAARAIAARGRRVRVLDRGAPGDGASARNAGFVLATHVTSYPAMRAGIGAELARALLRLAEDNHRAIERLAGGAAFEHRRTGSLMLGIAGDAAERAVLEEAARLLRDDDVAARFVDVPGALAGYDVALSIVRDGEVHPGKLVQTLAADVDGRRGEVVAIEERGVVLDGGARIGFEALVVATNAWTGRLLPELGVSPQRAQMLSTEPLPVRLTQPCYAGFGYEYFRQRADGRVLLGGRRARFFASEATADPQPSGEVQAALDAYLAEHLPFARGAQVEHRWAGTMGFSQDGLPLAGALRPHVHTLIAFTGHGLGTALALADVVARSITGTASSADEALLSALSPLRAPRPFEKA